MSARRREYEAYGLIGYVTILFMEENDGYLVAHPRHGPNERADNERIGRLLAEAGEAVVLLPNVGGRSSADAWRNGEEWEFKTIGAKNLARGIQNAIRRGKTQSSNILCFVNVADFHIHEIALGIFNAVKFDSKQQIQKIAILFRNGILVEMTRAEVISKLFFKKFTP